MKKTILTVACTLLVVFSMGAMRSRYNRIRGFGTLTQTAGNVLVSDGLEFESVAVIAYENVAVFYENEFVIY